MTSRRLPKLSDPTAQTMTEYALILALLVAGVIAVIPALGTAVLQLFSGVNAAFGG
jgi:Flp pilus assembly pilin Flp